MRRPSAARKRTPHLVVRNTPGKGRGVFAAEDIPRGTLIEVCPVVVLSAADTERVMRTALARYVFEWGADAGGASAVVLGYGSLYNHSFEPNADYRHREARACVTFWATRDIRAGEEVCTNYVGESSPKAAFDDWLQRGTAPEQSRGA
jgi:SET domain-containing protein